ncbi:hypothetical protein HX792_23380 [Pseudomonas sp. B6002]|uniref:hypothetical protein n=1 Tax=Pseudomonas sp. B6002 TaxID=2726978 RepID=UPI0015A121DC|nr:hypothetical protein [Pseudomonas sp. B6002]NVZ53302.1 hypothetical protein [Pseudomonas sp. B6002]
MLISQRPSLSVLTMGAPSDALLTLRRAPRSASDPADEDTYSRTAGDKVVVSNYIKALETAQSNNAEEYERTPIPVPAYSTLGQWWRQYREALANPAFLAWAQARGLDPSSMLLEPHSGFLTGSFNGKTLYLRPESDPGWKAISPPILEAAKVVAPVRAGDALVLESAAEDIPLEVVGNFYGETAEHMTREQAPVRARALSKTGRFPSDLSTDPQRTDAARSPEKLATQQQVLAGIDDRYSLMIGGPSQSAQARADRELAARYSALLQEGAWGEILGYGTRLPNVPGHSSFGQWWHYYCETYKSPDFLAWAAAKGLDLSTMVISKRDGTMYGEFNGEFQTLTLKDDSGWAQVAEPILKAGAAIAANPRFNHLRPPIGYPQDAPPLLLVGLFYGENTRALSKEQAKPDAQRIGANPALFNRTFDDTDPRSSRRLADLQLSAGKAQDRFNLIEGLEHVKRAIDMGAGGSTERLLAGISMPIHPHSAYAQEARTAKPATVSLKQFLEGSGFDVPTTRAQLLNLLAVLSFTLPDPAPHGNGWTLLGSGLLSAQQRADIVAQLPQVLATLKISGRVSDALAPTAGSTKASRQPENVLESMLSGAQAQALGKALETTLQGKSTPGRAAQWAMTALVLDLDPDAGVLRHKVAGYDLAQEKNWGRSPALILEELTRHLVAQGKVGLSQAGAAARLLLAGTAPAFLVRELPSNLIFGSQPWAILSMAVARIEQMAPGSSSAMTFTQVMAFSNTQPVTVTERQAQASAQRDALVDWGIINGVISRRPDDAYPSEDIERARVRFNVQQGQRLAASDAQQAEVPSRRTMALAELKAALGEGVDVESLSVTSEHPFSIAELLIPPFGLLERLSDTTAQRYSILELYMAGAFAHPTVNWICKDSNVPFESIKEKLKKLPDIKKRFHEKFQRYIGGLEDSIAVNIRNMIAQLPLEDRKNLAFGKPELFTVRQGLFVNPRSDYGSQAEVRKGYFGVLIRTTRTSPATCYELFPGRGELRKNIELPDPFELGPSNANEQPMVFQGGVTQGVEAGWPLNLDYDAYFKGTTPRAGARSTDVIIDRLSVSPGDVPADRPNLDQDRVPDSYFSSSTTTLASAVAGFLVSNIKAMETTAQGTTLFEKNQQFEQRVEETLLNMLPFVSAYKKARAGDTVGAFTDAELDVFGFLMPELKALDTGEGVVEKWGSRNLEAEALAPEAAQGDGLLVMGNRLGVLSAAGHGLNRQHLLTPSQLEALSRREDIAVGSVQVDSRTREVIAQYDETSAQWYAYDVQGGGSYGLPLSNFIPKASTALRNVVGTSSALVSLLGRHLQGSHQITMSTTMEAITQIDGELYTFEDTVQGVKRLNICAHGKELDILETLKGERSSVLLNGVEHSPSDLLEKLKGKNIDPSRYDNVRLLICYAGNGRTPFAQEFQRLIKRPVHAFVGPVTMTHGSTTMDKVFAAARASHGSAGEALVRSKFSNAQHRVVNVNPYSLMSEPAQYLKFTHKPVTFT